MQQCGSTAKTQAKEREAGITLCDSVAARQAEPTCADRMDRQGGWGNPPGKDAVRVGIVFCILRDLWVTRGYKLDKVSKLYVL